MSTEEPGEPEENDDSEDLRYFVRIGQTDLDGTKSVERALSEMNGIGQRTARIIANNVGVDRRETLGRLDDDTIDDLIEEVTGFADRNPAWLTNHRRGYFDGESAHVIGNDLEMVRRQDINRLQMVNTYRGVRHQSGQKVRGQRTKSTGRTEGTVGVNVERIREEEAEEAEETE